MRIFDWRQMDFEATFDQMLTLASSNPARVYKTNFYRKQTKNQWARDDPAFVVVQAGFLAAAAIAYGIAFRARGIGSYILLVSYAVLVDWLLFGIVTATLGWAIANKYLLQSHSHSVAQSVEWLYAFDIHCNAFFPLFLILYVVQFFLLPLLLARGFASMLFANALYGLAFSVYFYITHLGYRALPFLTRTEVYLYPVGAIACMFVTSLVLALVGFKINATQVCMAFYFG